MFIKEVVKELKEVFETTNEYQVSINHVFKNNGVELDGVVICKKDQKIAPNIYLNTYYDMYREGMSISNIISNIIEIYYNALDNRFVSTFELDFSFESIKDSIVYKVVNYENNIEMLKNIPYIKFLDLAIIFQCSVESSMDGLASVRITNEHIKSWGITTEMIYMIAKKNTPRLFPLVLKNMEDVLSELMGSKKIGRISDCINGEHKDVFMEDDGCYFNNKGNKNLKNKCVSDELDDMLDRVDLNRSFDMYVLSNIYGINGASAILYKGVLSKFADRLMKDLYIIPSSVHEVIVIPKRKEWGVGMLKEMVYDVNINQVPIEDVLANSVYEFSRENSELKVL